MKRHIILIIAILMAACGTSYAQTQMDTIRTRARITELTFQCKQLKQRIASEDKLRNSQLPDVAPEQMEIINLRQDSICLELRSQLAEVELELAELSAPNPANATGATSPTQTNPALQQIIQSLKPGRPQKKEEAAEDK